MNSQFLKKLLPNHNIYYPLLIAASILALIAAAIWFIGPMVQIGKQIPLAQPEKRLYVILFLLFSWLLKFLLFDLESPHPLQYKDGLIRKKLYEIQHRFNGAMQFLKKTPTGKQDKSSTLYQLPWYLLIGPANAGKTALLAHSGVNFILQRRLKQPGIAQKNLTASQNCDWWVTRNVSIIDVPSKYLTAFEQGPEKKQKSLILWRFFLRLIKKQRGKQGINGIMIALPLPEIMKYADSKKYQALLYHLLDNIRECEKTFSTSLPYQLIITKCDLLPGFNEFFAEASTDEIAQAWGITLPNVILGNKLNIAFTERFEALIKKLNQQLIWRLHQERNPMMRPFIKDFPLQMERLKEFIADFLKKLSGANIHISLQGVYLTSAEQEKAEEAMTIIDEAINVRERAIQIFKDPSPISRSYFIKQFLMQGLPEQPIFRKSKTKTTSSLNRILTYSTALSIVGAAAIFMGRDFERGIKQAYAIQNNLTEYKLAIQQLNDPNEHLLQTLNLLNTLQQSTKKIPFKFDFAYLLNFYSQQAQQKATIVYQQALQSILLPEIKNYLGDFLKIPINKNTDAVYAALKAYIMMGDTTHFDANFVADTIQQILPNTMQKNTASLDGHLRLALKNYFKPFILDTDLIVQTRKYFAGMQNFQLSYIILKNINSNNHDIEINLGLHSEALPKASLGKKNYQRLPAMFTAKFFSSIISQETVIAAQETMLGNWVLGDNANTMRDPSLTTNLLEALRLSYVNQYIAVWEKLIGNIKLPAVKSLSQTDILISHLISHESPMLQALQTLHDNTYFEPIYSASLKLQHLSALIDKSHEPNNQLYQIFNGLQNLHQFLQTVLTAQNEKKAAFEAVSSRMQNRTPDAITQLRLIAETSPEPIKSWLDKIANDTWHYLMQDALHYIDTTWQDQVLPIYKNDIANRYPFSTNSGRDVDIDKFVHFFGSRGVLLGYYQNYLQPFVDTSTSDWHWKAMDNNKLPFSDETLRQIQHAFRIHQTFFPNNDNKLYLQFGLQPYQFGKGIKEVKLKVNNKEFIDNAISIKNPKTQTAHVIAWPSKDTKKSASIQLTMANRQIINHRFSGDWGWFKLVNQSFESVLSKRQMLINLSFNEQAAKYVLFTNGQSNPFVSLNLRHFHLPEQLTDKKA